MPAASAQEHGEEEAAHGDGSSLIGGPDWDDVRSVTLWSLASIAGGCAALGCCTSSSERSAASENPSWVAPISIMPSSGLPQDGDTPHDAHGSHAPAH
ncbi:MAG: hypothetical protein IPH65_17675 [Dehalococcoidia bacterium]|uniref:hypothetical protein n=1 Tax=Candidatus Amarobacter glycogenicus TaxID=3140699 RepID=UPI00313755D9|nr:hypothetical protein [Dehalococcoidia bacterium]